MHKVLVAIALQAGLLWGQAPSPSPSQGLRDAASTSGPVLQQETGPSAAAPPVTHQRAVVPVGNPTAPSETSTPQDAASTLHLVVDRSLFIETAKRMRRVYVTNPAVLDALAATPHQLVVTAKTPGTSSLVVWDEGGVSTLYTVFSDIDIGNLRAALANAFPADQIDVKAVRGKSLSFWGRGQRRSSRSGRNVGRCLRQGCGKRPYDQPETPGAGSVTSAIRRNRPE